jgi:molecular chaperone DnaK
VERRLGEIGDAVPPHEKGRAEMLVGDARQAVKEEAPLDRVRSLTSELQQVYHGLAAHEGASAGPGPGGRGEVPPQGESPTDDVIDADFDRG